MKKIKRKSQHEKVEDDDGYSTTANGSISPKTQREIAKIKEEQKILEKKCMKLL